MTLGSLIGESLDRLEALNIIPDSADDEEGLVQGGDINEEDHIHPDDEDMGGMEAPVTRSTKQPTSEQLSKLPTSAMQNRGMPYFEEMVENSRLGRIKRQKGGHTSRDGRMTVQWEVVEIDGDDSSPMETEVETSGSRPSNKRQKMDA